MIGPAAPNPPTDRERIEQLLDQLADRFSLVDPAAARAEVLELYDRSIPADGEFVLQGQLFGRLFRAAGRVKPHELRGPEALVTMLARLVEGMTRGIDQVMSQRD